jgi:hypothetical protein
VRGETERRCSREGLPEGAPVKERLTHHGLVREFSVIPLLLYPYRHCVS